MLGSKILPAILIVVPATVLLTAQACLSEPAAEECISRPTAITPRGAHWYYRINRAKQHCWYLGKADGRANASAVTSATPTSASAPQDGNAAEAPAAEAPEATSPPVAPAATAFAPAQAAPTQAASEPALPEQGPRMGFATRWPENLPNAEDLDQQEPAAISDSYAERHEATNTAAQMPSKWPGVRWRSYACGFRRRNGAAILHRRRHARYSVAAGRRMGREVRPPAAPVAHPRPVADDGRTASPAPARRFRGDGRDQTGSRNKARRFRSPHADADRSGLRPQDQSRRADARPAARWGVRAGSAGGAAGLSNKHRRVLFGLGSSGVTGECG